MIQLYVHKAYSAVAEAVLGIDTRGAVQPPNAEGVHYTPLPYPMVFRMLRMLRLDGNDVFVDVGCGKGRVVCCAARWRLRRVVALELNPRLLQETNENAGRLRGRKTRVEPVGLTAEAYGFEDATVVYLYNPFNARITAAVVNRLRDSYMAQPRPLRIVYANPVHDDILEAQGWLEKYLEWPADEYAVFGYRVSFWRSKAPLDSSRDQ